MEKYLTRQTQPARADSQTKRRQLAPKRQLAPTMSPPRRTSPEIPESPQSSQEAAPLLGERRQDSSQRVAPQLRSARDRPSASSGDPSNAAMDGGANTTEVGDAHQTSDVTRQLIRYTGSEARRQIEFTRGQMQKAPILNPFLLEMEKLRDHRPVRGELPFNWRRARGEGGDSAQPAAATSENDGNKLIEAQPSRRAVQRSAAKPRPQHSSGTATTARAQYRELAYLVPAPEAPTFSSSISQQTSLRNSGNKNVPRSTRPTWNPEMMATGPRSREAETASILVGMQFTPAINEAMPYGELRYRLESHSPDTREGPRRKKRRVESAKEAEKVVIDLTMEE
ncbi:hypothetical protein CB0940_09036 [Cercospora beticola]|uniref:Uncharacterized protein n=1 Tax=Cercospora beticola TaxID=122368 RepID=A0A2G5HFZ6_CERBT|nr:hypothetical protein CB0940_09036 [Cercospora beticola]PIA91458.1 hypothetical protein CB0940_09036 [Cercospora beticola]WPB06689.1 hypothetical protein RHO25_011348 [Cercospora beticola]